MTSNGTDPTLLSQNAPTVQDPLYLFKCDFMQAATQISSHTCVEHLMYIVVILCVISGNQL